MNGYQKACRVEKESTDDLLAFLDQQSDNGRFVLTAKGRLSRELQKTYGDAMVNAADGQIWCIEFKVETTHTGNLFIETWSNRSRFNRGWLDHLETDILLYYFRDAETLYSIDFKALKSWAFGSGDRPGSIYRYPEVRQRKYDQRNDTWGRKVPIVVVEREVGLRVWKKSPGSDGGVRWVHCERSATPLFDAEDALT